MAGETLQRRLGAHTVGMNPNLQAKRPRKASLATAQALHQDRCRGVWAVRVAAGLCERAEKQPACWLPSALVACAGAAVKCDLSIEGLADESGGL